MVELIVLGSGSRGNATLVRAPRGALLIDAGLSARQLARRLEAVGQPPDRIDAILLTHEHGDHVGGVRVFTRRHRTPVFGNPATLEAADRALGDAERVAFATGEPFAVGPFRVRSFSLPHDAVDPVGFVLEVEGVRIGYATDLGHVTRLVAERLRGCQAIVFEANHDREMLLAGDYPWEVKQRVAARLGHLNNEHAAAELRGIVGSETRHVVMAHLSERNNDPDLVRAVVGAELRAAGRGGIEVEVAQQERPARRVML